jgi:hypothetical protein
MFLFKFGQNYVFFSILARVVKQVHKDVVKTYCCCQTTLLSCRWGVQEYKLMLSAHQSKILHVFFFCFGPRSGQTLLKFIWLHVYFLLRYMFYLKSHPKLFSEIVQWPFIVLPDVIVFKDVWWHSKFDFLLLCKNLSVYAQNNFFLTLL